MSSPREIKQKKMYKLGTSTLYDNGYNGGKEMKDRN
jgi:hypothetical protein